MGTQMEENVPEMLGSDRERGTAWDQSTYRAQDSALVRMEQPASLRGVQATAWKLQNCSVLWDMEHIFPADSEYIIYNMYIDILSITSVGILNGMFLEEVFGAILSFVSWVTI